MAPRSSTYRTALLVIGLLTSVFAISTIAPAQEPESYTKALSLLETGDTAVALTQLRLATREDFGPAYLRLGALLSAQSTELDYDWKIRKEAREVLLKAWRLMGNDPEVLLEYGLLLRKQNIRVDAKRVLDRAWKAAIKKGDDFGPETRARIHYQLGRIYESWWEDWQELVMIPESAERISCSEKKQGGGRGGGRHWTVAVLCPDGWARQLEGVVPLADLKSEEHHRMVEHYRLALEADSGHVDAGVRLLSHLADSEEWTEYLTIARRLVRYAPDDARAHLFLALGYHEQGHDQNADTPFTRALELLPPNERLVFEDVGLLLTRDGRELYEDMDSAGRSDAARIFFTSADPLFLTDVEERRLEHYARLAWAELKFGDLTTGQRGWDSERGHIWVKYGRPWKWYQCCYAGLYGMTTQTLVRMVYWSYGENGPLFVFERALTYREAEMTSVSKQVAFRLETYFPELYRPVNVTSHSAIPHQTVRFRGSRPDLTQLEIYGAVPLDSLLAGPGTSLETGIFLFDQSYRPLWNDKQSAKVGNAPVGLSYTLELGRGKYRYGLEARLKAAESQARPVARAREALEIPGFPPGQLSISDLLLADAIRALELSPSTREELRIWPSRTMKFASGAPISLYFEVYGLSVDEDSLARYRVELAVEDVERRNVLEDVIRGIAGLFTRSDDQEPEVSWTRAVPISGDMSFDYVSVELATLEPGEYLIRLHITDLTTEQTAEQERRFQIEGAENR